MKTIRTSIVPALLLAIVVAAAVIAFSNSSGYFKTEFLNCAFLILLFGWPEYLLLVGAHYWLLRRYAWLRAPSYAAVLGAGMAVAIWGLGVLLHTVESPATAKEIWLGVAAFGSAGAVYGFGSACLYRRYQILA